MSSPTVLLPHSHPLPQRPGFVLPPRPRIHNKWSICRNFVYWGKCREEACPRAHVPYNDMIDLMEHLMERDDYPPELRSIKSRLTRPDFSRCRKSYSSDRICSSYLEGFCRSHERCPRAHLRPFDIYRSLVPARLYRAQETAVPRLESAPPATPIVPTTSAVAPVLTTDEDPIVKLPAKTVEPSPPNISEVGPVVPKNPIPDGALIPTEPDVPRHPQSPTMLSPNEIMMPIESAEQRDATSEELPETDRQPENVGTINHSKESSVESSLDSAISESTVSDDCGAMSAPAPLVPSAPPGLHRPTLPTTQLPLKPQEQPICLDWWHGRCRGTGCKYRHVPPRMALVHNNPPVVPLGHVNQPLPPQPPPKLQDQVVPLGHVKQPLPPQKPQDQVVPLGHLKQPLPLRKLQDQPSLVQHKPSDRFTLSVMEATKVDFSGGFSIAKIVTGFESLWFSIENVPKTTKRDAIEHLVDPFGKVQDVRFRDESPNYDSALTVVKVQMTSYREVVRAIDGLDGREVFGHPITVQLSLANHLTKRMIRDNYVRVSWPVPSKSGYAGYSTLEAAQKAVSKADGMTERKYWVTASMYEGIPVVGAYNVRFMGLPPDTTEKFFDKFGPTEATMMERPNYQAHSFGVPAVRKTLESFGKITTFQQVPPPYKKGWVRVWCRFESPDVAGAACELNRIKQRSLGMVKVSVRRVLSVQESVPRAKFDLVEQDLFRLRQNVWNLVDGAHLDIISHREGQDPAVRLVAEDSKTLARLRVELSEILDGEILKENGQQVWDDFLRCDAGTPFLNDLRVRNPRVVISVYSFRRCVRLIGPVEARKSVAKAILAKLSSLGNISPDLMAAQQRHGEENIHLDSKRQVLCVRGPEKLYEEVQQIIQTVKSRHVAAADDDHCPVCLEPPLTPVSLSCGHKWCNACLIAYLNAASDTRSFPISCLGNQGRCTELVSISLARRVLPPADFDALALAAFHVHVQARPGEYHYCPTPDCPQAYPSGPRNSTLTCPSCLVRICPSCHVEYHEGITCADREDGGDRLFHEWMRAHGVKKCPGCHAPIERSEGCNHMTCTRCHTHTCWVCLDTFPEGEGIYDHMREYHGGIGL
ncbi:hypothetical protein BJV78DRAFT_1207615 [Lactifluus subvellereus]|nr:hypothetical protein BJV78DRAFT_1207615 [Lactifluus subvellereus]